MNDMKCDLGYVASNLLDGGWTSADAVEIQTEYNLNDDEISELIKIMKEMEK